LFIADLDGGIQFDLAYSADFQMPVPGNVCAGPAAGIITSVQALQHLYLWQDRRPSLRPGF
jgi:hypothetical protein